MRSHSINMLIQFILTLALFSLCSCTMGTAQLTKNHKKTELVAMLTDPNVRKDFKAIKTIAKNAQLDNNHSNHYFSSTDLHSIDQLSQSIGSLLRDDYHINPRYRKVQIIIAKQEYNSCDQYYNSLQQNQIGTDCVESSTCHSCNHLVKQILARPSLGIIRSGLWDNEKIMALTDSVELTNHERVFIALFISVE